MLLHPAEPIRLIALDLDGTLLRSDHTVGPRTIAALRAAKSKGVEIVLASGRMTPAMEPAVKALGLDLFLVSYNGAAVRSRIEHGRELLYHRPLPVDIAAQLYAWSFERGLQVNYYLDDVIHSEDGPHLRPFIDIYRERTGSPYRFVDSLKDYLHREPTKLLLVLEPSKREAIAAHWKAILGTRAAVVRTEDEYLEFLAPGASKGDAVGFVAEKLGIKLSEVMAMGDGENDVSMFARVGWPVAVPNARPACKAAAKICTERDNDNDAVAEAVERWVLH